MRAPLPNTVRRYRTLFISDLHLGTKGCQSHLLLDFLRTVDADTIYLVGDIVDGWRLKSSWPGRRSITTSSKAPPQGAKASG